MLGTPVFLLSAAGMMIEIAMTRVFSVMTWHHFTHLVLASALLGFGAAGSVLSARRRSGPESLTADGIRDDLARFSVAAVVCFHLLVRMSFEPGRIGEDANEIVNLLLIEILLALPFFFAGSALIGILTIGRAEVSKLYFLDLVGAAVGAVGALVLLESLGAPGLVFLSAACAGAASLALARETRDGWAASLGATALALGALTINAAYQPDLVLPPPSKELASQRDPFRRRSTIDYQRWNAVARIDVGERRVGGVPPFGGDLSARFANARWPTRMIFQDGSAPTWLLASAPVERMDFLDGYLQSVPYALTTRPRVLVIGVGGGIDVLIALRHDAQHVTGVEINPITLGLLHGPFHSFANPAFDRPDVRLVNAEGRHFVASSRERFDVIQLSGVDTLSALSSGAYALAENYLYTRDAVDQFWDRLTPDGMLSFSRWHLTPPRETLRLVATFVEVLEQRGMREPWRHLVMVRGPSWCDTVMRRRPFRDDELDALENWAASLGFEVLFDPRHPRGTPFDSVARLSPPERARFYDSYPALIEPVGDDRPFFFNYYRWSNVFREPGSFTGNRTTAFPTALLTLLWSFVQVLGLACLGVLAPLGRLGERGDRLRAPVLAYFSGLGLAYMLVEIALLQKLMVALGGPTKALSIVLSVMLLASGVGSAYAPRIMARLGARRLGVCIGVCLLLSLVVIEVLLRPSLGFPLLARSIVLLGPVVPSAVLMGVPMPTGLAWLGERRPSWIAWAWAANSFFTVLGPIVAVMLGMSLGFRAVIFLGAFVYVLALVVLDRAQTREPTMPAQVTA